MPGQILGADPRPKNVSSPSGSCCCPAPAVPAGPRDSRSGAAPWKIQIIPAAAAFAPGLVFAEEIIRSAGIVPYCVLMLASYLWCGWPVLRESAEAIRRCDFFNEFTLMGGATLVAIFIGQLPEAVGVMLFYAIGEAVQGAAAGRSRRSIASLLASKPEQAVVMRKGKAVAMPPEQVPVGSVILVKPGEKIPLDGLVISGSASLDMSSLTGEPLPAARGVDDAVYSGSICLDGDLLIRTTSAFAESAVGKILAMVENAIAKKSKTERFITVFARYYTPAVVAAAVLAATVPPLFFGREWNECIYRSLVILVVSCPCALVLSVPLAFFAGIGAISRHGVLVKGGQVFDAVVKAKTVVMDKTGTITEGRLSQIETRPAAGVSEGELMRLAALAESRSNHPVARAVVEAAGTVSDLPEGISIRDVAGKGVVATAPEGEIVVGSARLLEERGVSLDRGAPDRLGVYVALDGRYMGRLSFEDRIKEESRQAVRDLRELAGVTNIQMLTGDRAETAEKVAAAVGLDGFRADLLPGDKIDAYRQLSPDGTALFAGDGVNDAPVLAGAGVGVAMGALGAAAAVEAADAVILDDSPARLPLLYRAAAKTRTVAWQNILFALVVKTAVMVLGVAGLSGLWEAVFADVGVALLAILNSMRVARL